MFLNRYMVKLTLESKHITLLEAQYKRPVVTVKWALHLLAPPLCMPISC